MCVAYKSLYVCIENTASKIVLIPTQLKKHLISTLMPHLKFSYLG